MDGRIIFRRARLVVASLATLLLFVGAASAVVTHEPSAPEAGTTSVDQHAVRADVVGVTLAAPRALAAAALAEPEPEAAAIAPATTTTTAPAPTTTTTAPPTTTTTTAPAPAPTATTAPPTTTTTAPPTTTTTTAPTTTTTVAPSADGPPADHLYLGEAEVRALVAAYFPASEVDKAVLVAACETTGGWGWDAYAYNPSGPYGGLFQHSLSDWDRRAQLAGWTGSNWWDPEANVAVSAHWLSLTSWTQWSCANRVAD